MPLSAEHVVAPGRAVASEDSTDALVGSPANLAWLPAPELRWTGLRCPNEAVKVGCGQAWAVGTPLPFGLSTGLRVDIVQPPWGASETVGVSFPFRGQDYVWLTWDVAARLGDRVAVAVELERAYSRNPLLDQLFGLSAALSWRPSPHLAFSVVARDFNRPSPDLEPVGAGTTVAPILDGRYVAALAFRPTGRRNVDIGAELQYWEGLDEWTPRATLGLDVPTVGRLYGSVEAGRLWSNHQGIVGSAGLELHQLLFGGASAGGGALFGDGLGAAGTAGEYATAAIAGYTQPGIPRMARAVWIRLEDTPSTRGHVALLQRLWDLAARRDIEAVTLVLRAEPASSFAHAEELADAIRLLRARGKKVLCSWELGGSKALYVCASANRTVVSPGGGVRYMGLASQYIYLKGLLDHLGIKAEIVRIGPHKSAGEQFTNEHAGPVADEDHADLLANQQAVFERNLVLYRGMSAARAKEVAEKGPYVAEEARAAGIVDGLAFDDELERATRELVGRQVAYEKDEPEKKAPQTFPGRGKIAVLYLDGDIVDGRSRRIPLIDVRLVGSYTIADSIRALRDDPDVRAVVLRVESPGGSSLASDVMWRELMLLAKRKPLIVSMGSVAASGGYYVASASRNIFAMPLTITGSIGVFSGKADLSGLLSKVGVTVDTYKTAPRADAESLFRGLTPDERREAEHKIEQIYDVFLDRVHQGRGTPVTELDAVGRGRVWLGQQAYARHLVDHLGGLREALEAARAAAHLPDDAPIVEAPEEPHTLVQMVLDAVSPGAEAGGLPLSTLPPGVASLARSLAPVVIYPDFEPLARMDLMDISPE